MTKCVTKKIKVVLMGWSDPDVLFFHKMEANFTLSQKHLFQITWIFPFIIWYNMCGYVCSTLRPNQMHLNKYGVIVIKA